MTAIFIQSHKYLFYILTAYGVAFGIFSILVLVSWYQLKGVRKRHAQLVSK
ncbi:MAG: heme exporter protein CcmD [Janthinobacterium lividum]